MLILSHDLRYAMRQLRRSPMFALTAVLTLGLGLGGAATMYRVVHDVLLAPLPYRAPGQLVGVGFTYPSEKANGEQTGATADFLVGHSRSFFSLGVADDGISGVNLSFAHGAPAQVEARRVSRGYLPTLGAAPVLGRPFTRDEDLPHGSRAVLLSYPLWQRSFHGDRSIVGSAIRLDGEPYTVVGIMPASFRDPSTDEPAQLWKPMQLSPEDPGYDGDNYQMIARLKPGVTAAAAQAELGALDEPFYRSFPHYRSWTSDVASHRQLHEYRAWPLATVLTSNVRASLLTMSAAVGAVLLIACLNLAGVMMTRGAERSRELAVRQALGASRANLLRLHASEGLLLALVGAALAILLADAVTPALLTASPLPLPVLGSASGWQTAAFVLAAALAACGLFAVLPALHTLGRPATAVLPGRADAGVNRSQARVGRWLLVGQVGLATVLLSAAGLFLGVFLKLQATSPGFAPQRLTAAQVTLKGPAYATTQAKTRFVERVLAGLDHAPGVSRAAAIDGLPLDRGLNIGMMPSDRPALRQTAELRPATPSYFQTLGLQLLAGRLLQESDRAGAPPVAVISEAAAKKWWPGRSPIGARVSFAGKDPTPPMEIVGVVSDTHTNSLAEPNRILIYAPYGQLPDETTKMINGWIATSFVVRTSGDVPVARLLAGVIRAADPAIPVAKTATLQAVIDKTTAAPRFFSWLATGFAAFALLLTVIGLFGLLSYQVAQRRREFGLRLAVGATRERILISVVRRGLTLTAAGLALGLGVSLLVPRLVGSVLADVLYTGDTPVTSLLGSSCLAALLAAASLLLAALAASSLPAWRASRVDPMEALRSE